MNAVLISLPCLGLCLGALPAQTDRPIDDPAGIPPIEKPLGTIGRGETIENAERLLRPQLPAGYPPTANGKELDKWMRENFPQWESRLPPESGGIAIPYERKPGDNRLVGAPSGGAQWKIGVQLEAEAGGAGSELRIAGVMEGMPAKRAGLKRGDVLLELNKLKLRNFAMLTELIQIIEDQEIELTVQRGKAQKKVRLTPQKHVEKRREDPAPRPFKPSVPVEPKAKPNPELKPGAPPKVQPLMRKAVTPEERHFERLHQDNKEIQGLLRELIGEVKKLGE